MPRLYLHIGTPKSGSSSIQNFLSAHRARLPYQTLDAFGGVMGTRLRYVIDTAEARRSRASSRRFAHLPRFEDATEGLWDAAEAELARPRGAAPPVLVSCEHVYAFCDTDRAAIGRLASDLSRLFDDVRVVVYLRPQVKYVKSVYGQMVKGPARHTGTLEAFLSDRAALRSLCDYAGRIALWAERFGEEKLTVVCAEHGNYPEGNLLLDFLRRVDIADDGLEALARHQPRANVSPSYGQIRAMRLANRLGLPRAQAKALAKSPLARRLGPQRFPTEWDAEIEEMSRAGNAWINERFLRDCPVRLPV